MTSPDHNNSVKWYSVSFLWKTYKEIKAALKGLVAQLTQFSYSRLLYVHVLHNDKSSYN